MPRQIFDLFNDRGQMRRSDLEAVGRAAAFALAGPIGLAGATIFQGSFGSLESPTQPLWIWALINGPQNPDGSYPFKEVFEDTTTPVAWEDPAKPATAAIIPLYELNGASVGDGVVRAWLNDNGTHYLFSAPGGSGAASPFSECLAASTVNIAALTGPQTVDGVALVAGNRVLLTAQSTPSQNGPWLVQAAAWTRPPEYTGTVQPGFFATTANGTANQNTIWTLTGTSAVVVDSTSTTWDAYASANTAGMISTGTQTIPGSKNFVANVGFNLNQATSGAVATFYTSNSSVPNSAFCVIDPQAGGAGGIGSIRFGVNCRFVLCGAESYANAAPNASDWRFYSDGSLLHFCQGATNSTETDYLTLVGGSSPTLAIQGGITPRFSVGGTPGVSGTYGGLTITGGIVTTATGAPGTITGVTTASGSGLTGGASSGSVALAVNPDGTTLDVNGSNQLEVAAGGIGLAQINSSAGVTGTF